MFRVLSEEEAAGAIRWKAPDLSAQPSQYAKTREWASPISTGSDQPLRSFTTDPANKAGNRDSHFSDAERQSLQQSAEQIQSGTANTSVEMLQSSYDDGYAIGFAEGNAARHQEAVRSLDTLMESIARSAATAEDTQLQQEVVSLSLDIARLIIQREITLDPAVMLDLVKAGLEQIPSLQSNRPRVHLSPADATVVRELMSKEQDLLIVDDVTLQRGQCVISSEHSQINAGVTNWLDAIARDLGIIDEQPDSPETHEQATDSEEGS